MTSDAFAIGDGRNISSEGRRLPTAGIFGVVPSAGKAHNEDERDPGTRLHAPTVAQLVLFVDPGDAPV